MPALQNNFGPSSTGTSLPFTSRIFGLGLPASPFAADAAAGDQKRVATPRRALDDGASILVIGRPITQAANPDQAARAIAATL